MTEQYDKRRAKPTPADKDAARRLKAIWMAKKPRPTQESMAEQWGEQGGTQGLIGQYLNGIIPLSLKAVLRFAQILRCAPQEIRDDLPELKSHQAFADDPYAQELWTLWGKLDEDTKRYLLVTARGRLKLGTEEGPTSARPPARTTALRPSRRLSHHPKDAHRLG